MRLAVDRLKDIRSVTKSCMGNVKIDADTLLAMCDLLERAHDLLDEQKTHGIVGKFPNLQSCPVCDETKARLADVWIDISRWREGK